MKLKRFNTLNEAKKESKKEFEKKVLNFLLKKLEEKKLSRADMIKVIKEKFISDEYNEKRIVNIANNFADKMIHQPGKKDYNIKVDKFKGGVKTDPKKYYDYFYIGYDAKDPTGLEKKKSKNLKESRTTRLSRFDSFI